MSELFAWGGQSIWSFSFSITPSNQHPRLISLRMDWLDLLAVQGTLKSLLQYHSSKASILRHSAFFTVQLSHPYMTTGKTIALTRQTFVCKVMSLLFNMLSRLVITFLPRSKHLLISCLQSPSAVILEPQKIKSDTVSTWSPLYHSPHSRYIWGHMSNSSQKDSGWKMHVTSRSRQLREPVHLCHLCFPTHNSRGCISRFHSCRMEWEVSKKQAPEISRFYLLWQLGLIILIHLGTLILQRTLWLQCYLKLECRLQPTCQITIDHEQLNVVDQQGRSSITSPWEPLILLLCSLAWAMWCGKTRRKKDTV